MVIIYDNNRKKENSTHHFDSYTIQQLDHSI